MTENNTLDLIKQALICNICQEVCTLPVHPECCDIAKTMSPGCLSCVRKYYQLNRPATQREFVIKSWTGCGCDIYLSSTIRSYNLYTHTTQLDMIRNSLGPSICFNEGCGLSFETSAELRRHLNGAATINDKHGNCPESVTKCKFCHLFGKRRFIEGSHYIKEHTTIRCDICNTFITRVNLLEHYNRHKKELEDFSNKIQDLEHQVTLAML